MFLNGFSSKNLVAACRLPAGVVPGMCCLLLCAQEFIAGLCWQHKLDMARHKGVGPDADNIWFSSGERDWKLFSSADFQESVLYSDGVLSHTCVRRVRAHMAPVLSVQKRALWSTCNKMDKGLTGLQHVSIHIDFSKTCVCLQMNQSWKSEAQVSLPHRKKIRSQQDICSWCQPNAGILLVSSDWCWMLFWKMFFTQGVYVDAFKRNLMAGIHIRLAADLACPYPKKFKMQSVKVRRSCRYNKSCVLGYFIFVYHRSLFCIIFLQTAVSWKKTRNCLTLRRERKKESM